MDGSILEIVKHAIEIFLHIDKYLAQIISQYGIWTYGILFFVVFCETGLVVTPFLPGDSLLFAAGSLAALGAGINPNVMFVVLASAAILGDTVNYWVGNKLGHKVFHEKSRFLKLEYLNRTHAFYEKHGGKTIILARFIPIIRTFAPFVGGIGAMSYGKFLLYNVVGAIAWTSLFIYSGFFFGNIPFIRKNFSMVIIAIILISVLPIFIEFLRSRKLKAAKQAD